MNTIIDEYYKFNQEQKLIHKLLLESHFLRKVGLFNGQMGIIITFFHYARHTNNGVYNDYANFLLKDLTQSMSSTINIGFAEGVSGVAWGMEYLIQNNFVDGDSNDICEEIDSAIMLVDLKRLKDYTLEKGIEGIFHYILARISGAIKQKNKIPFDDEYFRNVNSISHTILSNNYSSNLITLSKLIIEFIENNKCNYSLDLRNFVLPVDKCSKSGLGIRQGLAGEILNKIL